MRPPPGPRCAPGGGAETVGTHEEVVEVAASASRVYAALTRFPELPAVLAGAEEVRHEAPNRLRWRARGIDGGPAEWTATIVENVPDRQISWEAEDPRGESRAFAIEPLGEGSSRVSMRVTGPAADAARDDLVRLRAWVEAGAPPASGAPGVTVPESR